MSAAPEGYPVDQWHLDAVAVAGTSHTLHPRQYVVACEWCDAIFHGDTKTAAMARFREHEREMQESAYRSADARRALAELRDRLDATDDATTERVLDHLLREAPDMNRSLLREAAQIDPDVVADALRAEGAMP